MHTSETLLGTHTSENPSTQALHGAFGHWIILTFHSVLN